MRKIIIIEEDDWPEGRAPAHPARQFPTYYTDGYICPVCGKHVGSLEVHSHDGLYHSPFLDRS